MRPYNNLKRVRYNTGDNTPKPPDQGYFAGDPLTEETLASFIATFKTSSPIELNGGVLGIALDPEINPHLPADTPSLASCAGSMCLFEALGADLLEVGRWSQMLGLGDQVDELVQPTTNIHELAFADLIQELESGELEGFGPILTSHSKVGDVFFSAMRRFLELQMKHFTSQNLATMDELKKAKEDCNSLDANEKFTCTYEINFTLDGIKSVVKIFNNLIIKMGGVVDNVLTDAVEQLIQGTSELQQPEGFCEALGYIKSSSVGNQAPDIIPPVGGDVRPKILKYKEQVTTRNYIIIGLTCFLLLFIYLTVKKK